MNRLVERVIEPTTIGSRSRDVVNNAGPGNWHGQSTVSQQGTVETRWVEAGFHEVSGCWTLATGRPVAAVAQPLDEILAKTHGEG